MLRNGITFEAKFKELKNKLSSEHKAGFQIDIAPIIYLIQRHGTLLKTLLSYSKAFKSRNIRFWQSYLNIPNVEQKLKPNIIEI